MHSIGDYLLIEVLFSLIRFTFLLDLLRKIDPEMKKWSPYVAKITSHYKKLRKYDVIYELYVCFENDYMD